MMVLVGFRFSNDWTAIWRLPELKVSIFGVKMETEEPKLKKIDLVPVVFRTTTEESSILGLKSKSDEASQCCLHFVLIHILNKLALLRKKYRSNWSSTEAHSWIPVRRGIFNHV